MMTNHYHWVIETPEGNLGRGMRPLNGVYTQRLNRRHGRTGHVFQGQYKAILVERDSYFKKLCRYVVLNPVRATMVNRLGEWPWSSYRAITRLECGPRWLSVDRLLGQFSRDPGRACAAYRCFVAEGMQHPSIWKALRDQIYLGSEAFIEYDEENCGPFQGPL
jgi:putative transposase